MNGQAVVELIVQEHQVCSLRKIVLAPRHITLVQLMAQAIRKPLCDITQNLQTKFPAGEA